MRIMRMAMLSLAVVCLSLSMTSTVMSQQGACPQSVIMSSMPMVMPVVANKDMMSKMSSDQNVIVMTPMSVDKDMMSKLTSNANISVAMVPVVFPVASSRPLSSGAASGAGPSSVSMDQMLSNKNVMFAPMMTPVAMDQATMDKISSGQPIMVDQAMVNKFASTSQPMSVMPMMMGSWFTSASTGVSTGAAAGAGPGSAPIMMDKQTASTMMGDRTVVMVPMMLNRQSANTMIANNCIAVSIPVMTSLPTSCVIPACR